MAKQFFQSWLPSPQKVSSLKFMRIFGQRTLNPVLWYVNRKSIAKAVFIGTFFGLLPIPFHSIFIVAAILFFEVNLPVGLALAWLSNPFTLVPILYIGFWIGTQIFHVHMINKEMMLGVLHQICNWVKHLGHGHIDLSLAKILMSGLIIEAFVVALVLYLITEIFWRFSIYRHWKKRKENQLNTTLPNVHRKTTP
ncbi:DUF2062 domain-containing protein [Acinetobacter ursingii]|uniref:DUF2062 domain-containing protein n=1 Tax=Acinetobacter ursingii TaxID=108980 RepID=UPI0021CFA422|nr:DUF2062 domain-containing protein [Acinetobacter ursingii]MEC8058301.1 DUF2062 domain-containing protein [Pseudomonadota bacterium]MCU4358279.1 DUF2062 domain-containing protein [Acinetobacter ursingii]MDA3577617.1 DUF2062 domain-containing protein [Acinetobacter ursingii]MDH0807879.1 DUF2062 domain-containing protein [Acinetobacter ursingii]MDH2074771.1 DUF2062 domain-containing protein [Acinetobacter ursingii]